MSSEKQLSISRQASVEYRVAFLISVNSVVSTSCRPMFMFMSFHLTLSFTHNIISFLFQNECWQSVVLKVFICHYHIHKADPQQHIIKQLTVWVCFSLDLTLEGVHWVLEDTMDSRLFSANVYASVFSCFFSCMFCLFVLSCYAHILPMLWQSNRIFYDCVFSDEMNGWHEFCRRTKDALSVFWDCRQIKTKNKKKNTMKQCFRTR